MQVGFGLVRNTADVGNASAFFGVFCLALTSMTVTRLGYLFKDQRHAIVSPDIILDFDVGVVEAVADYFCHRLFPKFGLSFSRWYHRLHLNANHVVSLPSRSSTLRLT